MKRSRGLKLFEFLSWKHFTRDDLISVVASRSPASEDGAFDCDTVIQSLTVLGVKNKPSRVVVHLSGEEHLPDNYSSTFKKQSLQSAVTDEAKTGCDKHSGQTISRQDNNTQYK